MVLFCSTPAQVFAEQEGWDYNDLPDFSSDNQPCGQHCSYKKSNEKMAVESLYLMNRVDKIEANKDSIRQNLPGFCFSDESNEVCFLRYKEVTARELEKIKAGIVTNNANVKALDSDKSTRFLHDKRNENKLSQFPHLITFDEMKGKYKQHHRGPSKSQREEYKSLVKSHAPQEKDFIKYKPDGTMDSSCNKPVCYDQDAYLHAKRKYETDQVELLKKIERLDNKIPRREGRELEDNLSQETVDAYNWARKIGVDAANSKIDSHEIVFKKSDREPAAATRITGNEKIRTPKIGSQGIYLTIDPETVENGIQGIKSKK